MGFLGWLGGRGRSEGAINDRPSVRQYGPGEMAFRFEKPFAHMNHLMTPAERKVVEGIEARWREQYEAFKNYPQSNEGQAWDMKVFQAVDDASRAMHAREGGPHKDWKALEASVENAFQEVRGAFVGQRKQLEHELAEAREYTQKLAPEYKDRGPVR